MRLFYAPGACSLSPHIVAREAGIELRLQKVELKTKTMAVEGDGARMDASDPAGAEPLRSVRARQSSRRCARSEAGRPAARV
jgi:hypothetical protein